MEPAESTMKRLADELIKEAEAEEKIAKQFKGCSFMGEWPGSHHLRKAGLLRNAAMFMLLRK